MLDTVKPSENNAAKVTRLFSVVVTASVGSLIALAQTQAQTLAATAIGPKPDALLTIDLNRSAVVERIVEQWRSELDGMSAASFKDKLMKLRADQLMAANLSGSFDAVLERLAAPAEPHATPSPADAARAGVVDADRLERLVRQESLSVNHRKALGEIDKDLVYTPIAPCNLMDTRPGVSPVPPEGGPALAPGYAVRAVQVTGRCLVPAGAKGIAALYTIENIPSSGGVVFAGDAGGTGGAVVSWSAPSQYSSGSGITPLSTAGAMQLQSAGTTHIKVDVTGYFMPPTRNGDGLRIVTLIGNTIPNVINGDSTNAIVTTSGDMLGATISGGSGNIVGDSTGGSGLYGTIGGGLNNRVGDATVGGGDFGTVGGGDANTASGGASTVGGGTINAASGFASTVPGGSANVAGGRYSFAAGNRAKVRTAAQIGGTNTSGDQGTFVWADSSVGADFTSTGLNQFLIRAAGGLGLNNNNPAGVAIKVGTGATNGNGANLTNGGTWTNGSSRDFKDRFLNLNKADVLARVVALPITSWFYKGTNERHIGPVAEEFYAAFGMGNDQRYISTVDASGVALAAIQGLNKKLVADGKAKDAKITKLERELAAIKKKLGL